MKDSQKYLKNIKRLFPFYGKEEKEFIQDIKNQVEGLHDCSYDNLVEEIGEPTDIVASYYQNVDTDVLIKKMKIRSLVKNILIVIVIMTFITCLWKIHIYNKAYEEFSRQTFEWEETIEEIN